MTAGHRYLLVRAGGRRVGILVDRIAEVVELDRVYPVPSAEPALRGVVSLRDAIMPAVHLGALLDRTACPPALGAFGLVVTGTPGSLCLEVEAADAVRHAMALPVPPEATMPWAVAVIRDDDGTTVPLLDPVAIATALIVRMPEARLA